ncbi:MAG TPA: ABC transporter substrate-binding protein [Acidimicrobiales bacterium]|jgi:hypothetical protein|nr:ABC transporter substrate-binding protein [Acidimicrobiales bacterium]
MRHRRVVSLVLVVVVLVAVTACTRPKDQVEIGAAPSAGSGSGTQTGATTSSGGNGGGNSVDQAIANGDFGTLKQVCGGGKTAKVAPGTPGISGDTISLGVFSDPGSQVRPGLNQELFDTSDVFTAWCNSLGGVNGLKLKANHHDSALFNVKTEMIKACQQDFFLVGGGAVFDDTGESTRLECLLPNVPGYVVTFRARGADLVVQQSPGGNTAIDLGMARMLNDKFPDAKNHVGFLTGNLPSLTSVNGQYKEAGQHFGWKVVYNDLYPATGASTWVPYAQKMKQAGVKGLWYTGEPENLGKLIAAFGTLDYKLDWVAAAANEYDVKLLQNAGSALASVPAFVQINYAPFDEQPPAPTMAEYQALYKKFKPNGKSHAALGENSMSAWLLFATGLRKCATVDRKCVFEALKSIKGWDAGGLQAPADPAHNNVPGQCFAVMRASPDGFSLVKWHANHGIYNCDAKNVVALKGKYGEGATLASVGKSMADLK